MLGAKIFAIEDSVLDLDLFSYQSTILKITSVREATKRIKIGDGAIQPLTNPGG